MLKKFTSLYLKKSRGLLTKLHNCSCQYPDKVILIYSPKAMINEEAFISGVEGDLGTIERDEEGLVSRINLYVPGHGVSGNEFQLSSFKSVWSQLSRLPSYARHRKQIIFFIIYKMYVNVHIYCLFHV